MCRRKYRSKTALNRHVKYDCGKPPKFECSVESCSYRAYQKVHLIRHLYRIHKIATIKNGRVVGNLWTGRSSIFPNGLEHLLKNIPDGQIVLLKKNGLDNQSRQKLVKVIIDHLISQNPSHRFPGVLREAAEEIVELFPGERMESYYIPYSKKTYSKDKILPRGKLYSRWVNCKRALTIATNKIDRPNEGQNRDRDGQPTSSVDITDNEKLCYDSLLQPESAVWEETLKDWKCTYNIRMLKLKALESLLYFNTFPALKQPMGYKLLEEDFYMKYPNAKAQSLHQIWPGVASAIVEILRGKQIQAPELYSMSVDLAILSIKVFPWLFQPTILRSKITKKLFKLNRLEMADRFFLHVVGPHDLDARINDRRKKLQEFDIKLQPLMVVVGPLQNPQAFFVVLDNQRYMFNDILTTLDVTFKIFFALNLPFPCECKYLWQTIDQLVYKINTNTAPSSSVVLSEIEQRMKK